MINRLKPYKISLIAALITLILDQATKLSVLHLIETPQSVLPFFDIVLVYNHGVSFGFMAAQSPFMPYLLSLMSASIAVLFFLWLRHTQALYLKIAMGLVIAGALGNIIDRLYLGAVVDFLDFYIPWQGQNFHYPSFNIADSAIFIGVVCVMIDSFKKDDKKEEA